MEAKIFAEVNELARRLAELRTGRIIVHTNGCFDILHSGHVSYLARARDLGDLLVVSLNNDASVRGLKGEGRPLNRAEDRALVLAALACVDCVCFFGEATPERNIRTLRPDIHCKGGDYQPEQLPEAAVVESGGGRIEILPFVTGYSTTALVDRIRSLG
ncbi:MAG: D-glycero-beta-D-manno-heptose 1-phosphate adenylyltransferase [Leptospirales bacterium]|nr:D-glycero-beta-D-manno-heptose 1-phosphate adenylyltransferase [Leptospirales bacterium]